MQSWQPFVNRLAVKNLVIVAEATFKPDRVRQLLLAYFFWECRSAAGFIGLRPEFRAVARPGGPREVRAILEGEVGRQAFGPIEPRKLTELVDDYWLRGWRSPQSAEMPIALSPATARHSVGGRNHASYSSMTDRPFPCLKWRFPGIDEINSCLSRGTGECCAPSTGQCRPEALLRKLVQSGSRPSPPLSAPACAAQQFITYGSG